MIRCRPSPARLCDRMRGGALQGNRQSSQRRVRPQSFTPSAPENHVILASLVNFAGDMPIEVEQCASICDQGLSR